LRGRLLVFGEPLVDHGPVGAELRRRPISRRALRWRHRGLQRLADSTAMNTVALGQLPNRQSLSRSIAPDLLELLHSCHSLQTSASRSIERSASVAVRTEVGPVQASMVGPVEASTPRCKERASTDQRCTCCTETYARMDSVFFHALLGIGTIQFSPLAETGLWNSAFGHIRPKPNQTG
jgi:hypothetical protein